MAALLALGAGAAAVPANDPMAEAKAAIDRGDGISAEVAARRALDAGASRSEVAAFVGEAELLQKDFGDARKWLGPGDFSLSTRERGFHALGRLEVEDGDLAAAAAAFDRALQLGSENARLWVDIGRLRYRGGQHHLALQAAARAVAIDPDEPRALEFKAQLVRDAVGVRAALPLFEHALEKAPDDLGLLGEYAATLGEAGRHADMLRVARRMVQLDPRDPRAYYLQAVLAARAGLNDLARRLLEKTNGAYDEVPAGQLLAGIIELRGDNAALAVDEFDELTRRQPENASASLLLGRALLADGDANEVVAQYRPAADRLGASPYLLALVGRAYEQLGRRAEAARYLDRAQGATQAGIAVLPAEETTVAGAGAAVQQVRALLAQGQNGLARAMAATLREQFPDSIDVETLAGDVALLTGDPQQALALYRHVAEVRRDFTLVERMVAAQQRLGRDDEATRLLANYLRQNPRSFEAAAMLGRMTRSSALLAYADQLRGGRGRSESTGVAETALARR